MNRAMILHEAASIISNDREIEYGSPKTNFTRIADLWSAYTGLLLTPRDVAMMMVLLKVGRSVTSQNKEDHYIDIAGYAALGAELAEEYRVE